MSNVVALASLFHQWKKIDAVEGLLRFLGGRNHLGTFSSLSIDFCSASVFFFISVTSHPLISKIRRNESEIYSEGLLLSKNKELHVKAIAESSTAKLLPSLLMPTFTVISPTSSECICFYSI